MRHSIQVALLVVLVLAAVAPAAPKAEEPEGPRLLWKFPLRSNSFGGGAVADADGDGRLEIAFATYFGDSSVRVVNGEDGSPLWTWQGGEECLDASARFTDLDGDGKLELIVPVSNSSHVLCFEAATGKLLWRYEAGYGECIDTPPCVADTDGDGKPEVLVGTFKGHLHIVDSADGSRKRMLEVAPPYVQAGPIVTDIDGDGVMDFVITCFKGDHRVRAVNGKDGSEIWHVQARGNMYHGPSMGDFDGDGAPDFAIGDYSGTVWGIRGRDGKVLWSVRTGDSYIMSPTAIADLDGDGKQEVISAGRHITAIRASGRVLWKVDTDPEQPGINCNRGVSIADLDGDGGLDLAYVTHTGRFRAVRGRDGKPLYSFDGPAIHHRTGAHSNHSPMIADFDGDGRLDAFWVLGGGQQDRHGAAICITGFAGAGEGWYTFRHDRRNTGNVKTPLDPVLRAAIPTGATRPAKKPVATPPARPARPARAARPDFTEITPALRRAASRREVPAAVLQAAVAAHASLIERGGDWAEKRQALAEHGEKAFAAALAIIEAGPVHYRTDELLPVAPPEDAAEQLLALARGEVPTYSDWPVFRGLGFFDTPEVRDFLLTRLATCEDAGRYMSIARGLARLSERRGLAPVAARLMEFRERWSGVEVYLVKSLSGMGGEDAAPHLAAFLRDERADQPHSIDSAIEALSALDTPLAATVAAELLASTRSGKLTPRLVEKLKRIAE